MYKSRVSELCQKNCWPLPTYSMIKMGLDHQPRFKASVLINGNHFDSPIPCSTAKNAQNEAAKIAFQFFTCSPDSISVGSATNSPPGSITSVIPTDDPKHLLQNYATWKNLKAPVYSSEARSCSSDNAHGIQYKGVVSIDGCIFKSNEFFDSTHEAQSNAARLALTTLSLSEFRQEKQGPWKSKLKEFAEKEELGMPEFKTMMSELGHYSVVEIDGEAFEGKCAKSKKEAEVHAAQVAYTALLNRKIKKFDDDFFVSYALGEGSGYADPISAGLTVPDGLHKQNSISSDSESVCSLPIQAVKLNEKAKHVKEEEQVNNTIENPPALSNADVGLISVTKDKNEKINIHEVLSDKQQVQDSGSSSSTAKITVDMARVSISDHEKTGQSKPAGRSSSYKYLLCNRFGVYESIPDLEQYPEGFVAVPVGESEWVIVSLEFPNEKGK